MIARLFLYQCRERIYRMSCIRVCDLCGLPMPLDCGEKHYKIKERKVGWWVDEWVAIDAHESCIKKLLAEAALKKEWGG